VADTEVNPLRARRELMNGNTNHGIQFLAPDRQMLPTTYYGPNSGVGLAISAEDALHTAARVGVIGLGAGTIAAYGRPRDNYTFYEINPLVIAVAEHQFTFLRNCPAKIDLIAGDARLSLERQPPQDFDVLAVDAFTGDSIPLHLLTVEAFQLYFRHLRPDGLLAVHISSRYISLESVVARAADALNKSATVIANPENEATGVFRATWVLLSTDPQRLQSGPIGAHGYSPFRSPNVRLWTDDYSDPLRVLRF
jgi:spermidine synthase